MDCLPLKMFRRISFSFSDVRLYCSETSLAVFLCETSYGSEVSYHSPFSIFSLSVIIHLLTNTFSFCHTPSLNKNYPPIFYPFPYNFFIIRETLGAVLQNYEIVFQMTKETDPESVLSISMRQ